MSERDRRTPIATYLQPRNLVMLALGFSSGLPFLLVGNTLSFWLRDDHISLTTIGFVSGVGIAYSLKWLWAPIIDRVRAPVFGVLGHRRGWIVLAQVFVALGLFGMAMTGPVSSFSTLVVFAALVAFASATQDIVIDAWRIESARNPEELGMLTSTATFGYRMALLGTDAIFLIVAEKFGWSFSYVLYGALMAIGLVATLLAPEPERADEAIEKKSREFPLRTWRGIFDAIIGPFVAFFRAHGVLALAMLLAISLYRLPDFLMGPIVNPFYHDIGLTKDFVGEIRGSVGLIASLGGIAAGGFFVLRLGILRALVAGGVLQAVSIAAFALLAHPLPSPFLFCSVMAGDSFATSFAGVVLVVYMSSLTNLGYTATQYALLASAYTVVGKILKTLSGVAIDALTAHYGLMNAYGLFYVVCGLVGIPAIVLFVWLAARHRGEPASA